MAKKKKKKNIQLEEAWNELNQVAFSSWIYLCNCKKKLKNRKDVSEYLGFSMPKTNRVLRILKLLKYIKIESEGIGKPTTIIVLKRPIIDRKRKFSIFSSF